MVTVIQRLGRVKTIHQVVQKHTASFNNSSNYKKLYIRRGHTFGGVHPGNAPSFTKKPLASASISEDNIEEDEIDPDDAFEGPNALEMILPNYESENFSFDPDTGILQEREDEIKHYEEVIKPKREAIDKEQSLKFENVARDIDRHLPRDFEVSSNEEEWAYVQRLMPIKIVPQLSPAPSEDGSYPSGFVAPRTKPGDLPYHVSRTRNHMLPVYTVLNRPNLLVTTHISRCEGNLHELRKDLKQFLFDRYEQEFLSQTAELYGKVKFRGDFEQDFKEFLLSNGF